MKNTALLFEKDNAFRAAMFEVLSERGHNVDIYSGPLLETTTLASYDLVILKTRRPKFLFAGYRAKASGVRVVPEPLLAETIRNRVLCDNLMRAANILCPMSFYEIPAVLQHTAPDDLWPAVMKPLMSSGGRNIELIASASTLKGLPQNEPVYLQKFVIGRHLLVYFIGDEIYAFEKEARLGPESGDMRPIPVCSGLADMVSSFKKASGLLWGDLDLIAADDGKLYSVDPGIFPSFKYVPLSARTIVSDIISLIDQVRL